MRRSRSRHVARTTGEYRIEGDFQRLGSINPGKPDDVRLAVPKIVQSAPAAAVAAPRTPPRTVLQTSARRNRQVHALRAYSRIAGLVSMDVAGVLIGLVLLRAIHPMAQAGDVAQWFQWERWAGQETFQTIAAICSGLFLMDTYGGGDRRRDANRLASGTALGLLIALWQPLWNGFGNVAASFVVCVLLFISLVVLLRWTADRVLKQLGLVSHKPVSLLLIGNSEETERVRSTSSVGTKQSMVPVASLNPELRRGAWECGPHEYGMEDLPLAIARHNIDTIVLCGQLDDRTLTHVVLSSEAAGCRVMSQSRAFSLANLTPSICWQEGVPMIELTRPGLHGRDLMLKRIVDVVVAGGVLLAALPLLAVVAVLVRLTSPGPLIFRQQRIGYSGSPFTIFKFRTMFVDAEERLASLQGSSVYGDGKLFKMAKDPRITKLGSWLRKTTLDELPQLFNVLRGEMSLVGPRPPLPREVALYEDEEFIRFGMKPGVTGPWQVSGRNRITSFDDVLRIESAYFSGWTIWRDFRVLALTVPAVLKMDGAQ